jgi:hypothetical protein
MQIKSGKFMLNGREFAAHMIEEYPDVAFMQVSEIIAAIEARRDDFTDFAQMMFESGTAIAQRIVDLNETDNPIARMETLVSTGAALRFWQTQWDMGNRSPFLCTLMDALQVLEAQKGEEPC